MTLTGSEGAGAGGAGRTERSRSGARAGRIGSADRDAFSRSRSRGQDGEPYLHQNAGQSCICAKRMIVHADVYDAFLDRFEAGMKAVKIGDPMGRARA